MCYSPMIRSQSFSEPMSLDCEDIQGVFFPLRWDRMDRVDWRAVFPFSQVS